VAVVLIALIALLLAYLRSVFSFVLIKALTSGDAHVIQPLKENLGRGLRLFAFTLAAGILTLIVVLAIIAIAVLVILPAVQADTSSAAGIVTLILAISITCLLYC